MDPAGLRTEILRRWPGAEADVRPGPDADLEWRVPVAGEELRGRLAPGGRTIVLERRPEASARFAHWYRALVPPEQPLVMFDDAYADSAELSPATGLGELLGVFVGDAIGDPEEAEDRPA